MKKLIEIITTNKINNSQTWKITDYVENFVVVHHSQTRNLKVLADEVETNSYDVYCQDGIEQTISEDYESTNNEIFNFIPSRSIQESLDQIIEDILENYDTNDENEFVIVVVSDPISSKNICKYMNSKFTEEETDLKTMNLLEYMNMKSLDELSDSIKNTLNSDFVYPDDPISFSYAIRILLNGGKLQ